MSTLPVRPRPRPGRDAIFAGLLLLLAGVVGTVAVRQGAALPLPGESVPPATFVPPTVMRAALFRANDRLFGGRTIVRTYLQTGSRKPDRGARTPPHQAAMLPSATVSALLGNRSGSASVAVQEAFGPLGPSSGPQGLGWMVLATSPVPVKPTSVGRLPVGTKHAIAVWAAQSHIPLGTVSVWPFPTVTLVFGGGYGHAVMDLLPIHTRG